jgi:DNA-binding transcriptional ArsR family regulator
MGTSQWVEVAAILPGPGRKSLKDQGFSRIIAIPFRFFPSVPLLEILKYLKDRGEQLDSEIATAVGLPLESVRRHVSALSARGEIMTCHSTRFVEGRKIEGLLCRIAGYVPPAAPGRKPKAKALAS